MKALTKYKRSAPISKSSNLNWVIGLALVGLVVWFLLKNKGASTQYLNKEEWDISYDENGLPTKITIHRDARRS